MSSRHGLILLATPLGALRLRRPLQTFSTSMHSIPLDSILTRLILGAHLLIVAKSQSLSSDGRFHLATNKRLTRFANILKWTGVYTAAIDGCSEQSQIHVIQEAYHAITHCKVTTEELQTLSSKIGGVVDEKTKHNKNLLNALVKLLDSNATSLNDFQKDYILEMAI